MFDRYITRGVKWVLLANVAVFLIENLFFVPFARDDQFIGFLAQSPVVRFTQSEFGGMAVVINWLCPIQFVSYMFVHANVWHLFWNMLALWFFGPPLEALWGKRAFLKFYLFTGFGAGALHGLVAPFFLGQDYYMIGASGAVFGVLLAFAVLFPNQQVLLWFVLPMPSRYFVFLIGIMTLFALLGSGGGQISHFTHLAGLGFAYGWLWLRVRFPMAWLFNESRWPQWRVRRRRRK